MASDANKQKEEGNKFFKEGKWDEAITCYTSALNLNPDGGGNTANYLKNRAACYLKKQKYSEVIIDCTQALSIAPNDPKALFRRCQAYESMEKYEDAFNDAMHVRQVDPKNPAIQPVLLRLNPIIQRKVHEMNSTDSKVSHMFDISFGKTDADLEKRRVAANNLIVLARDDAGAEKIFHSGGVANLMRMVEHETDTELRVTAMRVLACLCKYNKNRAIAVLDQITLRMVCVYMGVDNDQLSAAMSNVLQNIINTATELDAIRKERDEFEAARKKNDNRGRPFPFLCEKIAPEGNALMDKIFPALIRMLVHVKVSSYGRDNAMELIIKYVARKDGTGWPNKFIQAGGVKNLLEVAGTIPEHKTVKVSSQTRMNAALALQKVYDELLSDKERDLYKESVNEFFNDLFGDDILESKLEAVMALSALLQGPYEVGSMVLSREGVLEIILAMVDSGNAVHVKNAVEALVFSASKKERCSGVIKQATPILKQLYQSQNDAIKVRALVGLCKLGSFGGSDASAKSFAEGSTTTLAKACRKFLCNQAKDVDLRKWASEGLSYLSLDADVKHELVNDEEALKSLMDLAKLKDKLMLYPIAQIFVNLTNSFDKKEVEPELMEIAKFAKQHVPEEHNKDKEPFITERVKKLAEAGVVSALVNLSADTDSDSTRELLSRVYCAVSQMPEFRGKMVAQGASKALLPLSLKGTDKGKNRAAQALARLGINTNPAIAFPGQRALEVVRPIMQLLHIERDAIENFEGLMCLTNLASMSDSVRRRILKEGALPNLEHYMFEEHEDLRRSATECVCNMVMLDEVVNSFTGENDRIKLLVLFCGEEDEKLVVAASGALAMLSRDEKICKKITECSEKYLDHLHCLLRHENMEINRRGLFIIGELTEQQVKVVHGMCTEQWFEILCILAAHEQTHIQHRALVIVQNMVDADKEVATKIVTSSLLEVLMAVSRLEGDMRKDARDCANAALNKAVDYGLIQHTKK